MGYAIPFFSLRGARAVGYKSQRASMKLLRETVCATALLAVSVVDTVDAATTIVDACGMSVGGYALLVTDLDCPATGITFATLGTLNMDGHTLRSTSPSDEVVLCWDGCRILGPGTIEGGNWG